MSGPATFFQGVLREPGRGSQCRGHTEEQTAEPREQNGKGKYRRVDSGRNEPGDIRRSECDERSHTPQCQDGPCGTACQRENQRLGEGLLNQVPPTRADRGPDGRLAPASGTPCQQEIGDVGARDEQHEAHGAKEGEKASSVAADQLAIKLGESDPAFLVVPGIPLSQ